MRSSSALAHALVAKTASTEAVVLLDITVPGPSRPSLVVAPPEKRALVSPSYSLNFMSIDSMPLFNSLLCLRSNLQGSAMNALILRKSLA